MKLLTICCTKERPKLCEKMVKSFLKTRKFADLIVYVWNKDEKIEKYKELDKKYPLIEFHYDKHRNYCPAINFVCTKLKSNYDYYQEINDDHFFITKNWDEKLIKPLEENNGWGISYPKNDAKEDDFRFLNKDGSFAYSGGHPLCKPYMGDNPEKENAVKIYQPSAVVISKKLIDTAGYFYYYRIRHFGGDDYIREFGFKLGMLYYMRDVFIEHQCWNGRERREKDDNDEWVYSQDEINHAKHWLGVWRDSVRDKKVKKVLEAMKNES